MKKLTLIISALALVMGLSQCRKPNVQAYAGDYEGITKDITFTTGNGGDGSKVTIDNDVLKELHYKWEANDVIHVYGSQKGDFTDGKYCGELKLVSAPGSQEGTFEGTLNNVPTEIGTSKIRFYYFGGGDKGATIDLSTQNGMIDNGASSLNKKIVASLDKTITSNTEYSGDLEVLFSIVKFDFHQFGSCNLTMRGMKSNAFKINEKGNVVETPGITAALSGITSASTEYFVAVMPYTTTTLDDVKTLRFLGNGKVGGKKPNNPLEANKFYTDNGNSYVIEANAVPVAPTVATHVCLDCAFAVGGVISSTTTQNCEYGVVYAKASDIADPDDLVIGGTNCTKFVENDRDVTNEDFTYTVDLEGLVDGVKYIVKAYAIGENNTPAYGDAMTFVAGDEPMEVPSNWVNGASPYTFSVSAETSVRFSQGNLQYIGSAETPYWKFAKHQFDFLGTKTGQNSLDEKVDRDWFGWGTSGINHGATCWQPWRTETIPSYYYAYNYANNNLYNDGVGEYPGRADWGYNAIKNGGDIQKSGLRTLTNDEWGYLIGSSSVKRDNAGNLHGMGKISCMPGLIILPDNWEWTGDVEDFGSTWTPGCSQWSNTYNYAQWAKMESRGAVFLPASGYRDGTTVYSLGSEGAYWSSSQRDADAYNIGFGTEIGVIAQGFGSRHRGYSVRLVRNAE